MLSPSWEEDWGRVCGIVWDVERGEGEETVIDFGLPMPFVTGGPDEGDEFLLKGLLRHFGPFCAGVLMSSCVYLWRWDRRSILQRQQEMENSCAQDITLEKKSIYNDCDRSINCRCAWWLRVEPVKAVCVCCCPRLPRCLQRPRDSQVAKEIRQRRQITSPCGTTIGRLACTAELASCQSTFPPAKPRSPPSNPQLFPGIASAPTTAAASSPVPPLGLLLFHFYSACLRDACFDVATALRGRSRFTRALRSWSVAFVFGHLHGAITHASTSSLV